ncbi:AraC family transcriptional regulator [Comamonas aquatilis]|uniref:hypothetical protein n=1 Tax=Comamonas aquatilis TaxID=1778406 RepID=UPI0039F138A2
MARTIGEVGLAAELWTPAIKQRFETLFAVASRQSLSSWREVPPGRAQVLVVDGGAAAPHAAASIPCVVYVGGEAANQPLGRSARGWAAHLDVNFTLSDLIDMLDRAAVFLMDWKACRSGPMAAPATAPACAPTSFPLSAPSALTLPAAMQDLLSMGENCTHQFQLASWVVLPGGVNSAQNSRVLALLARGPIAARALCEHGAIDIGQLQHLLAQAAVQKVLRCSLSTSEAAKPQHEVKNQPAAVSQGWVKKLTGWITRGGRI